MRLIDADALCEGRVSNDPVVIAAKCAPTIDTEPVRHASLKETGYDEAWCNWGDCTNCGTSNIFGSKYCNECGVKLVGGKQDGD